MYKLDICHLYPDLLNLYGDRGNIVTLVRRARWRGIEVTVSDVTIGDLYVPENHDITFLGGGQDYEQEIIQNDLLTCKAAGIKNAVSHGSVFMCICGGYQLMGKYYRTWDGKEIEFLGVLDIWTIGGAKRMIGNLAFECDFLMTEDCDGKVVGFENHSGRTYLGSGVRPLGRVTKGSGNNGEDGMEGAVYRNVYCSYSHGSLLPKNPALADHLISLALKRKYPDFVSLTHLDDTLENLAHETMLQRIGG